jgi:hypothetical protein
VALGVGALVQVFFDDLAQKVASGISPVVTVVLVLVAAAAAWVLRGVFRM